MVFKKIVEKLRDLRNRLKDIWLRYKRLPRYKRTIIRWSLLIPAAIVFDLALLVVLGSLTQANLIDWKTVISFLVIEVLAAVIAKLLGVGEESEEEERYRLLQTAILETQIAPKLSHLEIHYVSSKKGIPYPNEANFVVNTKQKPFKAFWVPQYIWALNAEGLIIDCPEHKSETNLKEYFDKEKIVKHKRYPKDDELNLL